MAGWATLIVRAGPWAAASEGRVCDIVRENQMRHIALHQRVFAPPALASARRGFEVLSDGLGELRHRIKGGS